MHKQYTFNGKTYQLNPITLSVMKCAIPVIVKLRKLQYEYTKDIDMRDVNIEKSRLAELETAKKQLSKLMLGDIMNEERLAIAEKISILNDKISAQKDELNLNEVFKQKTKLYNECFALAVYEVVTDTELIKPVIESLVTGSEGNDINIDYENTESIEFISKVIHDFFLHMQKNKMKPKD